MAVPPILTVTLNPALDVTASTDLVEPMRKVRLSTPRYDPGGGGVNVSRAIMALGGQSRAFIALGGGTGAHYRRLIEGAGFDFQIWPYEGETRFSLTVMEEATAKHFRFVLPGPMQAEGEADRLLAAIEPSLAASRYVVGSGSLPPGMPDDFYGRLTLAAQAHGTRMILDTHGAALREALPAKPWLIRLNHLEAQELVGGTDAEASAHLLAQQLIDRRAAEIVIVAVGDQGAIVTTAETQFQIRPPQVVVRSMVGAGDSFVGALALGFVRGLALEDATRFAVAAAAAAVTTEATELCDLATTNRLLAEMSRPLAPAE